MVHGRTPTVQVYVREKGGKRNFYPAPRNPDLSACYWLRYESLSEQVDTSTPAGKMVFTVLGAVAELERSLIVERVRAGLRNARAKGKHLGRPRKVPDATKIKQLRAQGASWRMIGKELNVSPATAHTAAKAV
jgi:DNA invertase Pin-like site-specific DNA recombinase